MVSYVVKCQHPAYILDSLCVLVHRSASDASASDLNHEYSTSYLNLLTQGSVQEDYIIEAVAPSNFKLLSQYVVIPKESAVKHGIFALQPIMVSLAESDSDEPGASISNLTLSLGPIPGAEAVDEHLALAIWYEDEATLQKYVPPPSLGYHYTRESLQLAYIHPHLLFNMFPETLSPTRKFTLHITVSVLLSPHGTSSPRSPVCVGKIIRSYSLLCSWNDSEQY